LQAGPIHHDECSEEDWLEKVKPIILERIQKYSESEIRFTLLAIVNNKRDIAENTLNEIHGQISAIQSKLVSLGVEINSTHMDVEFDEDYFNTLPEDVNLLQAEIFGKEDAARHQQSIMDHEKEKKCKMKRRKFKKKA